MWVCFWTLTRESWGMILNQRRNLENLTVAAHVKQGVCCRRGFEEL